MSTNVGDAAPLVFVRVTTLEFILEFEESKVGFEDVQKNVVGELGDRDHLVPAFMESVEDESVIEFDLGVDFLDSISERTLQDLTQSYRFDAVRTHQ